MNNINQWLLKQQRRQKFFISLYECLLNKRFLPYIVYRLRYFGLNIFVLTIVHVVEFYLLYKIFTDRYFISLVLLRSIGFVVSGAIWGGLEMLRTQVRNLYQAGERNKAKDEICCWLVFAALLCVVVIACVIPWLTASFSHILNWQVRLYDFYVFVILLQMVCQFMIRTFHSGIYALRRVRRPFYSISVSYVIGLVVLASTWPIFHTFSLPLSFLVSSCLSVILTAYYAFRTYEVTQILPDRMISLRKFGRFLARLPSYELLMSSISGVVLRVEGLLLFLILPGIRASNGYYADFLILYLIAPMIRSGFDWAILFYFDAKKLEAPWLKQFHYQLKQAVTKSSVAIGLMFWFLSMLVTYIYFKHIYLINWLMFPFIILRAPIAYLQIETFCRRHYYDVIISGLLTCVPIVGIYFSNLSIYTEFTIIIAGMLLSLWYISKHRTSVIRSIPPIAQPMLFYDWVKEFHHDRTINVLSLRKDASSLLKRQFLQKFAAINKISRIDENKVVAKTIDKHWLLENSIGLIRQHKVFAMKDYFAKGDAIVIISLLQLKEKFNQEFPQGLYIDLDHYGQRNIKTKLNAEICFELFQQMLGFVRSPLWISPLGTHYVSSVYQDAKFKVLFAIPRHRCSRKKAKYWHWIVHHYNLHQSFGSTGSPL